MIVEEYNSTTNIPIRDKNGVIIKKGDIVSMDGHTLMYEVEDFLDDGDIHIVSRDGKRHMKADPMSLESHCVHGVGLGVGLKVTHDKNGKILHIGDKVRIEGWNSIYTITDISKDNPRVIVSDNDGNNKGWFWTNEVELVDEECYSQEKIGKDGSGKDDRTDGKPRWELLPLETIEEIVKVYTMGAEKYADGAWKDILDGYRRYKAALLRHITAYDKGERVDKESGLSHLAHAAWNAIAMLYYDMNGKVYEGDAIKPRLNHHRDD